MTGRGFALIGRLLPAFIAASVLTACPAEQPEDLTVRDAAVYNAVISDMLRSNPVGTEDPEALPTIFVEAFDPEGIALEVQVELIASFSERYEIRFVDDRIEAVDVELSGAPVRPESLLLGLGSVVDVDGVGARAELYSSDTDVSAYFYNLQRSGSTWMIVGEPEEVDAEGFGATS